MKTEYTWIDWAGAGCVLLVLVMFLIEAIKDYRDGIKSYDEGDDQ